ncbi:MAG: thiamine phosphate synthase [Chlorobiaceae bacterium]|nr:thiamine phosphate synthase [Chlorobiaceae bacterium]
MKRVHPGLPRIMIVSSGREHLDAGGLVVKQAAALSESEPVLFQLREKGLEAAHLLELATRIKPLLDTSASRLMINERADIALLSGAYGIHLPENACPADSIRRTFPGLVAGQSAHSREAALDSMRSGVDYLIYGPVFATPLNERFGPPKGLEALGRICRSVRIPVFAVGGITPERSFACIEQGAWGVAAMAPFIDPGTLRKTITTFRSYLPS